MIKIKIITYGNFPFGGASANLLRNLAMGLINNNCNVEVLLPRGNYYGKKIEPDIEKKDKISGINYRFFIFKRHPVNIVGKLLDNFLGPLFLFFYLIYSKCINGIDFIIKYNIALTSQSFLLIISKILNIKIVNIVPEFYEKPNNKNISFIKWLNFYYGFEYILKYSNGNIALTNYLFDKLNKQKNNLNILIQPNIVDPSGFINVDHNIRENVIIGYAGTPTKKDGILDLFASFKLVLEKHKSAQLLVIGDLTNGNTVIPELQKRCVELEIINNVKFTGLVPFNKIPTLLNGCDILVLTRPNGVFAQAGFPTKLGEYFACKRPVVITRVGDIDYYFKDKKIVQIVEPENIKDIANGIIALIDDPKKRVKLGQAGYEWMLENLEYKNVAKKIHLYLNKL